MVGGGVQGLRRINRLLAEGCRIILYADVIHPDVQKHVDSKSVRLVHGRVRNADFLHADNPYVVIAATDDADLNRLILREACRIGCLAYSVDDPDASDFAHLSIADIKGVLRVAISTGGRSPIIANAIRQKIEEFLNDAISDDILMRLQLQETARKESRSVIGSGARRREFLHSIEHDETIKQLIAALDFTGAQKRMMALLEECT